MEYPVKKAPAFKIKQRGNGRFVVTKRGGGVINGEEKVKILQEAGKIKKLKAKAKAEGEAAPAAT